MREVRSAGAASLSRRLRLRNVLRPVVREQQQVLSGKSLTMMTRLSRGVTSSELWTC